MGSRKVTSIPVSAAVFHFLLLYHVNFQGVRTFLIQAALLSGECLLHCWATV